MSSIDVQASWLQRQQRANSLQGMTIAAAELQWATWYPDSTFATQPTTAADDWYVCAAGMNFGAPCSDADAQPLTVTATPKPCRRGAGGTLTLNEIADSVGGGTRLYPSIDANGRGIASSTLWEEDPNFGTWNDQMHSTPHNTTNGGTSSASLGGGGQDIKLGQFTIQMDAALAAVLAAGGAIIRAQFRANSRHGIGINESIQDNISQISVRVTQGATATIRGTAYAGHSLVTSSGSAKWAASATARNRVFPPAGADNVLSAVAGATSGDYLVVEVGYRSFTAGTTGATLTVNDTAASDLPQDETTSENLRSWIEICA